MATRIYQKSLNRLIKIPFQNAEFHEAEFTQPCPKQSDLETAMNLEVPPSVLPSLTKLRNIPEGEEKSGTAVHRPPKLNLTLVCYLTGF